MNRNRTGKSLIEVLIVLSIASLVFTLSAQTFARLMRADKAARHSLVARSNLTRLAKAFRQDVNSATNATTADDAKQLTLQQQNGIRIEYRAENETVTRQTLQGETRLSRDEFKLADSDNHFEIVAGPPKVVVLVHQTGGYDQLPNAPAVDRPRTVKMEAVRGRDLRFLEETP